jgi:hypothetical protein
MRLSAKGGEGAPAPIRLSANEVKGPLPPIGRGKGPFTSDSQAHTSLGGFPAGTLFTAAPLVLGDVRLTAGNGRQGSGSAGSSGM